MPLRARRQDVIPDAPREVAFKAAEAQAVAVWNSIPRPTQVAIAREQVYTRRYELRLAYEQDVRSIGYGYRIMENRRGIALRDKIVCITFLVEEKRAPEAVQRPIPAHLYAYVELHGQRQLCAVPTDVQGMNDTGKITTQGNMMVTAVSNTPVSGMPCCVVRYPGGPRYLLGCHHVFACSDVTTTVPGGVSICDRVQQPAGIVGNLSGFMGGLGPGNYFFDSALASIVDANLLTRLVTEPDPACTVIQGEAELATAYQIHTGRGIIEADYLTIHHDYAASEYGAFSNVVLPVVVEVQPRNGLTQAGDSGSPVFDDSGTIFQGMHVAANRANAAFFIPVYELLRAKNYQFSDDESDMLELA